MENNTNTNTIVIVERKYRTKTERFITSMKLVNTLLFTSALIALVKFLRDGKLEITVEDITDITDELETKGEE